MKVRLKVKLFGHLRNSLGNSLGNALGNSVANSSNEMEIVVDKGATLSDVKKSVSESLSEYSVISECAFADETRLLDDTWKVSGDGTIAVLPPVCGG